MPRIMRGALAEDRESAARPRVPDPDAVVVEQRARKPSRREVVERQRLVARRELTAQHRAFEAGADVVPDVAVGIPHDLQRRLRIDTHDPTWTDGQPCLLAHLSDDGLRDRLADLDRTAGQAPLATVGALLEEEPPAPIEDHR